MTGQPANAARLRFARRLTVTAALLLAFALPLGGVRMLVVEIACCCPSPERCKCPDHDEPPDQPTMQACHRTLEAFQTPAIPAFIAPHVMSTELVRVELRAEHAAIAIPHAPPPPRRPDAPS